MFKARWRPLWLFNATTSVDNVYLFSTSINKDLQSGLTDKENTGHPEDIRIKIKTKKGKIITARTPKSQITNFLYSTFNTTDVEPNAFQ